MALFQMNVDQLIQTGDHANFLVATHLSWRQLREILTTFCNHTVTLRKGLCCLYVSCLMPAVTCYACYDLHAVSSIYGVLNCWHMTQLFVFSLGALIGGIWIQIHYLIHYLKLKRTFGTTLNNTRHTMYQQHSPHRPQSAQETISSHLPVFLFSISSPRQKSQYLLAVTDLLAAAVDDVVVIESATAAARLLTTANQKQRPKFNRKTDCPAPHWLLTCQVWDTCINCTSGTTLAATNEEGDETN